MVASLLQSEEGQELDTCEVRAGQGLKMKFPYDREA